jgi:hypothetical protein
MGIINNKKSKLYRIGGTANHLHLLFDMHPTIALSDFMREIKEHSSKWMAQNQNFPDFEGWAVSFAAFTYNLNDKQTIINYIRNQKEHHKTVGFEDEYRQFLIENGIEINEKYFLRVRKFCSLGRGSVRCTAAGNAIACLRLRKSSPSGYNIKSFK